MLNISKRNDLRSLDFIVLTIFIGIVATLANYGYGVENHISKLPPILREIDNSYLRNDFYVNVSSEFGPLFYFVKFTAFLANLAPLHIVALFLTLLSNGLVALITFSFARELFDGSNLAGILAACIVMSIDREGPIGQAAIIYDRIMLPGGLIMPLILLAVWAAIRHRPIICMILAGAASILHPLVGMGAGGILLLTIIVSKIFQRNQCSANDSTPLISIIIAPVVLAAFSAFWLLPYSSSTHIPSDQFIEIMAHFRNPHHYIPSTFGEVAYFKTVSLLIAFGIAWYWWPKTTEVSMYRANFVLILTALVLLLLAGGYIFVEIIPIRIWVSVQAFRFLFLIRWIGFILVAGNIANRLSTQKNNFYATLFLVSTISPIAIGITHFSQLSKNWIKARFAWLGVYLETAPVFMLVVLVLLFEESATPAIMLLTLLIFIALAFVSWPRKAFYSVLGGAIILFILTGWFRQDIELPPIIDKTLIGKLIKPQITLQDLSGNAVDVAEYARENTPKDSLFLTPPFFGQFRLTAERAIIVDFKAFPFQDTAMVEWQQRLFDCYGKPASSGFPAVKEMEKNYEIIDDSKIRDLKAKYGISYAVLYKQTPTQFPNLYENQEYKIIQVY